MVKSLDLKVNLQWSLFFGSISKWGQNHKSHIENYVKCQQLAKPWSQSSIGHTLKCKIYFHERKSKQPDNNVLLRVVVVVLLIHNPRKVITFSPNQISNQVLEGYKSVMQR